jgi:hypothetical protein
VPRAVLHKAGRSAKPKKERQRKETLGKRPSIGAGTKARLQYAVAGLSDGPELTLHTNDLE